MKDQIFNFLILSKICFLFLKLFLASDAKLASPTFGFPSLTLSLISRSEEEVSEKAAILSSKKSKRWNAMKGEKSEL